MSKKTAAGTTKTTVRTLDEAPDLTAAAPNPLCADGCGSRVNSAKSTFLQGHDQRLISDLSYRVVDGEMGPFQRGLLGLVENPKTTAADEFYYVESGDIQARINTINAAIAHRFSVGLADKFASAAMAKWEKWGRQTERAAQKALKAQERAAKKASTESPSTKAVFRRLQKESDVAGTPVGATLSTDTKDAFWADAVAYLGDKTDLKSATIKAADWDRIYTYFASGLVAAEPTPAKITGSEKKTVGQEIQNLRGSAVRVKIGRWTYDATVVGMNQAGKITAVEYVDKKGAEKTTDNFKLVQQPPLELKAK